MPRVSYPVPEGTRQCTGKGRVRVSSSGVSMGNSAVPNPVTQDKIQAKVGKHPANATVWTRAVHVDPKNWIAIRIEAVLVIRLRITEMDAVVAADSECARIRTVHLRVDCIPHILIYLEVRVAPA